VVVEEAGVEPGGTEGASEPQA
ncbi:MAG: hypothetical protein ACD_28C00323G0001, partial [uncultured bacterium]